MKTHRQNKRPLPVPGTVLDKERADRRQHAQGSGLSQRGRDALFLQPSGFTLVELLIVIAIIAILFGLLATGLSRAKTAAQRIVCLNNLKQWGSATHIYAHENDDHLPREAAFDGINPWEATGSPTNSDVVERGRRMVEILEKLAAMNAFSEISDPVEWQREIRKDRPLPGRET